MDFLTVVPAAGQGFRHEIGRESLRIGRSSGNDLALGATTLIFNGAPQSPIEFSDRPLLPGSGATFLPASSTRTPSGGAIPLLLEAAPPPAAAPAGLVTAARTLPGQATPGPAPFQAGIPSASLLSIIFEADKELVFHRPLGE